MNFAGVQSITIPEGDVRSIAIGGATVWTKPNPLPYDAEVEYLESTGTQYVDTGVVPTIDTVISAKCQYTYTSTAYLVGAMSNNYRTNCYALSGNHDSSRNSYFRSFVNGSPATTSSYGNWTDGRLNTGTLTSFEVGSTGCKLNGVFYQYDESPNAPLDITHNLFLFTRNDKGTPSSYLAKMKLLSCAIYDGSTLVRSFVPVRVGTVGYLYDRANPTGGPLGNGLYGSATSTPLVAGPDKNGG